MERLVTVRDIKERYGCSGATARRYIRSFPLFYENPLTAPRWALDQWEKSRVRSAPVRGSYGRTTQRKKPGPVYVPRQR